MKKYIIGGIIISFVAGWFIYPQVQQYLKRQELVKKGWAIRTGYQGNAEIESISTDGLIARLKTAQEAHKTSCNYSIDKNTATIRIFSLGFGPSGFSILGNTLSISTDLEGKKNIETFEKGIEAEIARCGNVVTLIKRTAKITKTWDTTGIVY